MIKKINIPVLAKFLFMLLFVVACGRKQTIHFYSLDMSQCITSINEGNYKYVINGKHTNVPNTDYVKLDVGHIDPVGMGMHICWKNSKYEWEVVIDKSKIVENKLDSSRFHFSTSLPSDDRGIPTEVKYRKDHCAVFSYYIMRLSPEQGAIVEID